MLSLVATQLEQLYELKPDGTDLKCPMMKLPSRLVACDGSSKSKDVRVITTLWIEN